MINLETIRVIYGDRKAVDGVTATATAGEFIALVGPNGSGKSSLLKALAGVVAFSGEATLSGQPSYLAQSPVAPARAKVRDVIALGRTPHLGPMTRLRDVDKAAVATAMTDVGITDFANRRIGALSGGEQARVHLARVLATQAQCVLADEPVTALDPYYQLAIMDVLQAQAKDGRVVITALHDLSLAARYASRIWVMQNGKLYADGPPDTALNETTLAQVFRITPDGRRL